jgi:hypothetical protein
MEGYIGNVPLIDFGAVSGIFSGNFIPMFLFPFRELY